MISASNGKRLFMGVKKMGKSDISLFTFHKSRTHEAQNILQNLRLVLHTSLSAQSLEDHNVQGDKHREHEYEVLQKQESE